MFHIKYGPFLLKFLSSQWQLKCVRFKIYRNSYSIEILAYHRYLQHVTYKYVIINYLFGYFAICVQTSPIHRKVVNTCLIFLWQKLTVKNTWHAFHSVLENQNIYCYLLRPIDSLMTARVIIFLFNVRKLPCLGKKHAT